MPGDPHADLKRRSQNFKLEKRDLLLTPKKSQITTDEYVPSQGEIEYAQDTAKGYVRGVISKSVSKAAASQQEMSEF